MPSTGTANASVTIPGSWPTDVRVRFGDRPAVVTRVDPLSARVKVPTSRTGGTVDVIMLDADGITELHRFRGAFAYLAEPGSEPPVEEGDIEEPTTPLPRTIGPVITTDTNLRVVRLDGTHPGSLMTGSAWPPACATDCSGMSL